LKNRPLHSDFQYVKTHYTFGEKNTIYETDMDTGYNTDTNTYTLIII
jgi:hypothetical protein